MNCRQRYDPKCSHNYAQNINRTITIKNEDLGEGSTQSTSCIPDSQVPQEQEPESAGNYIIENESSDSSVDEFFLQDEKKYKLELRLPYTAKEDLDILQFVLQDNNIFRTSSISLWKELEFKNIIPNRTHQSLKNRFIRNIKPKLFSTFQHHLSEENVQMIKSRFPEFKNKKFPIKRPLLPVKLSEKSNSSTRIYVEVDRLLQKNLNTNNLRKSTCQCESKKTVEEKNEALNFQPKNNSETHAVNTLLDEELSEAVAVSMKELGTNANTSSNSKLSEMVKDTATQTEWNNINFHDVNNIKKGTHKSFEVNSLNNEEFVNDPGQKISLGKEPFCGTINIGINLVIKHERENSTVIDEAVNDNCNSPISLNVNLLIEPDTSDSDGDVTEINESNKPSLKAEKSDSNTVQKRNKQSGEKRRFSSEKRKKKLIRKKCNSKPSIPKLKEYNFKKLKVLSTSEKVLLRMLLNKLNDCKQKESVGEIPHSNCNNPSNGEPSNIKSTELCKTSLLPGENVESNMDKAMSVDSEEVCYSETNCSVDDEFSIAIAQGKTSRSYRLIKSVSENDEQSCCGGKYGFNISQQLSDNETNKSRSQSSLHYETMTCEPVFIKVNENPKKIFNRKKLVDLEESKDVENHCKKEVLLKNMLEMLANTSESGSDYLSIIEKHTSNKKLQL